MQPIPRKPYRYLTDPGNPYPLPMSKEQAHYVRNVVKDWCGHLDRSLNLLKRDGNYLFGLGILDGIRKILEDYRHPDNPQIGEMGEMAMTFFIYRLTDKQIDKIRVRALGLLKRLCKHTDPYYRPKLAGYHQLAKNLLEIFNYLTDTKGRHPRYGQLSQPTYGVPHGRPPAHSHRSATRPARSTEESSSYDRYPPPPPPPPPSASASKEAQE